MRYRPSTLIQNRSGLLLILTGIFLAVAIPFYIALCYAQYGPPTPELRKYLAHTYPSWHAKEVDAPPPILSIFSSPSPLTFAPPSPLPPPTCPLTPNSPILLSLHIFSDARHQAWTAKSRRDVIRRTILMGVPHVYRHLVEVKFILGRSWDPSQEIVTDHEDKFQKDMLRLAIPDGDGERGKAAEWLRVIAGQRVAQWVVKCNDDVIPILPNLIPYLLSLDPTKPTIIGSSFHTNHTSAPHFAKHMWGLSWGLVKTIGESHMHDDEKNREVGEGEYVGEMMMSLPSLPGHEDVAPGSQARISPYPTSPDPRTGLIWADVGREISPWGDYWATKADKALAWYGITDDHAYEETVIKAIIYDIQSAGRKYLWDVPEDLKYLASRCKK